MHKNYLFKHGFSASARKSVALQETIHGVAPIQITVAVSIMQAYKSALMFILLLKARITTHLDIDAFHKNFIDVYNT